jgi:hypothetical protein
MKEGERKIDEYLANAGKAINGWRVSGLPGDSAHYNGDWLKRAAAAERHDLSGAAALLAEDNAAVDPATRRRNLAAAWREEGLIAPRDRAAHTSTRPLLALLVAFSGSSFR